MIMWIYTIEPSLEIIQFEASETRGEYKVAYSEIIYVGFKLPKWPRRPVWVYYTTFVGQSYHICGILYLICGILYYKSEFPRIPYAVYDPVLIW